MKIEYIGTKALKRDVVAGTGIEWHGRGDVQEVKDEGAAAKLLAFVDIWRQAGDRTGVVTHAPTITKPLPTTAPTNPPAVTGLSASNVPATATSKPGIDSMDKAALRAFATVHGVDREGRLDGDKLRAAVHAAVNKA